MSKVFYDDLINLDDVEKRIKKNVKDKESREEIYQLIDEIIHHRVLGCILDRLPKQHHKEFINHISVRPHDKGILNFLGERVAEDVVEFIQDEIHSLSGELLEIVHEASAPKKTSKKRKN